MGIYNEMFEKFSQFKDVVNKLGDVDKDFKVFGSSVHKYKFNEVLSEEEIFQFEQRATFKLPLVLKEFYKNVGNGGAGPSYGLYGLDELQVFRGVYNAEKNTLTTLLAIMEDGCGGYLCLKSNSPENTLYYYNPDDVGFEEISSDMLDFCTTWLMEKTLESSSVLMS